MLLATVNEAEAQRLVNILRPAGSSRSWIKIAGIVAAGLIALCVGNAIFGALSDLDEPDRTPSTATMTATSITSTATSLARNGTPATTVAQSPVSAPAIAPVASTTAFASGGTIDDVESSAAAHCDNRLRRRALSAQRNVLRLYDADRHEQQRRGTRSSHF